MTTIGPQVGETWVNKRLPFNPALVTAVDPDHDRVSFKKPMEDQTDGRYSEFIQEYHNPYNGTATTSMDLIPPPTALPADVYLDKLEKLHNTHASRLEAVLLENSRLRAMLGECVGVLRAVVATNESCSEDWCDTAVDPVINRLTAMLNLK